MNRRESIEQKKCEKEVFDIERTHCGRISSTTSKGYHRIEMVTNIIHQVYPGEQQERHISENSSLNGNDDGK